MTEKSTAAPAAPGTLSGRARAAGVRVGGLVIAILLVIVVFTLLAKPNTFFTFTNALGVMRSMSTIACKHNGATSRLEWHLQCCGP